ncbi:ABC transporter permease [Streptacidiphilus sp. 4-A2]|nr:ABC transporter permease [Streptacidiphilus sp. 4-A2]
MSGTTVTQRPPAAARPATARFRPAEGLAQTWFMTRRQFTAFARQPAYLVITLIQPVIWLCLFGALFHKVVELPGFGGGSYLDYLVPGVIVMSAVSANMWAGMGTLEEIERGTLNRFLITPVRRSALMNANVIAQSVTTALQSLIIIALGWAGGAHYPGGLPGILVLVLASSALGTIFGAFSNALGMLVRERESIIGINTFLLLPLTFLSSAFMAPALMPHWMQVVARFNPVNWALEAGRAAMAARPDWWSVFSHGSWTLLLAAFAVWLSLRTFRSYQKSV